MGASVPAIILLLSRESISLVALAFVVAAPISYLALNSWLQTFSFHTSASIWPMVFAGGLVLIISWVTVSTQSMKAASAEPVKSLKYE